MNRESGKGILFGVLGIMTLIIAILGASLAYFTAQASGESEVLIQSAVVTIGYEEGTEQLTAEQLIPSSKSVAQKAYKNVNPEYGQCKDAKGFQVCGVFRFYADNKQGKFSQRIYGTITTATDLSGEQTKEFDNLAYTVFRVTCTDESDDSTCTREEVNKVELSYFTKVGAAEPAQLFNDNSGIADTQNTYEIAAGERVKFEILYWLNETGENQNHEQGLSFLGKVSIGVSGASGQITGTY